MTIILVAEGCVSICAEIWRKADIRAKN